MTCGELMTRDVACCSPEDRVDAVATLMRERKVGALPVVGPDNRPVGMVTDRDLTVTICAEAEDSYYKKVKEIMHSPVVYCTDTDDISVAVAAMADHRIHRIPVLNSQKELVGIITVDDLARTLNAETVGHLLAKLSATLEDTSEHASEPTKRTNFVGF